MKIAVIGATGRIGRQVAGIFGARGHEVVPISRASGVDVYTGAGLADALAGVQVVVEASNTAVGDTSTMVDFFTTAARNLQRTAAAAGVESIVAISIIGIDAFPEGHFAAKLAQERALDEGKVPVRVLRAAQFHEFTEMVLEWGADDDVARVPRMRTQLVSSLAVAEKLVDMALDADPHAPARIDIAGPTEYRLVDAAAAVAARRGYPSRVEEAADPNSPNQALQDAGALLPGPDALITGQSFDDWLDERYPLTSGT